MRTAVHTLGAGCQGLREHCGPYSQIIVRVGLELPGSTLKDLHSVYLCSCQLRAFLDLGHLRKQLWPKAFKGPHVGYSSLGTRATVRTTNRP